MSALKPSRASSTPTPFHVSKVAWVECRITGPALITHTPAVNGAKTFVAPAGTFDLRANRIGLSCKLIE